MEYIIGKFISAKEDTFIFESNGIGYAFRGSIDKSASQIFIHTIVNVRTLEKIKYAFTRLEEKECFNELLSIKGFGPSSALKLIKQNKLSEISQARVTGNIYKLNASGIKPSILSLIVTQDNKNTEAEAILIKQSLEKYGFKSSDVTSAMKTSYSPAKKIDKNIISIIKTINAKK